MPPARMYRGYTRAGATASTAATLLLRPQQRFLRHEAAGLRPEGSVIPTSIAEKQHSLELELREAVEEGLKDVNQRGVELRSSPLGQLCANGAAGQERAVGPA